MRLLLAVAVLLATVGAGNASAATLSAAPDPAHGTEMLAHYVAAPGEVNDVSVTSPDDATVEVHDAGAVISAGDSCASLDAHTARCTSLTPTRAMHRLAIELGDGDDRVESLGDYGTGLLADGGPGDDTLIGSLGLADELDGGGGHDTLLGRGSADTLTDGDDPSAPDDDVFRGGPGRDTVSYASRTAPVYVDLGSPRADGQKGEHDTLIAVNSVVGGSGDDRLAGRGGTNELEGMRGDDRIAGRGGVDILRGGRGHDTVLGGVATDDIYGGTGPDELYGGRGGDELHPGSGTDRARCGRGPDVTLYPRADDLLDSGCEHAFFGRGGDAFSTDAYPAQHHRDSLRYRVACPRSDDSGGLSEPIRGAVRLREAGGRERTLGTGTISRGVGEHCGREPVPRSVDVTVHLTTLGRRLAARHGGVRSTVELRVSLPDRSWPGHREWTITLRT